MKRASICGVLAAIFLVAILFASADAISSYTYDSDIDPKVIKKWNMVFMEPFDQRLLMAYKNPDIAAEISAGFIVSKYPGVCVAFSYYKNNKAYLFIYNRDTRHYMREKNQKIVEFMKQMFQRILGCIST